MGGSLSFHRFLASLIAAGTSATINVAGPVVNEAQTLNAYWHSHWVQETGDFSADKRHDIWACGSVAECTALYGSAFTNVGGSIDPPTPVGNIAATIQAPNLTITSNGQIQNVGNILGTSITLTGQRLINGITTANTYTPHVNAPSQVISLSPVDLPGLNLALPRASGSASTTTAVAGTASYVEQSLGSSSLVGPQQLISALPANLQPSSTLFYYNPQEEDLVLQQAALKQTGQASFISGLAYDSTNGLSVTDQEKAVLYQNAIDYAQQNNLHLGNALSQTQINALTQPMLWYVEQTVPDPSCTAVGTMTCPTITALMPQVYLPQNWSALSAGGNIQGTNVTLNFDQNGQGSILNTGSIAASNTLTVNTQSLVNEANQVNVGNIWQYVDGAGYADTTGTQVQPGGFMSAANMNLNVQTLQQIGGALQQLNADGSVNAAGTQQMLAALQQQLGGNFTQTSVSDHLDTNFVAEGGFGAMQVFEMVAAIVLSVVTAGAGAALVGAAAGTMEAAVANAAFSAVVSSLATDAISGNFSLAGIAESVGVAVLTAGITNGITYNSGTGSLGVASWSTPLKSGTETLGQLAGSAPVVGTTVAQASGAVASTLPQQALAIAAQSTLEAGVQSAIEGGSFLRDLETDAVNSVAASGAYAIGDSTDPLSIANIAEHAGLGCFASAAEGTGCAGGAIGGAASALVAPVVRDGLYDGSETVTTTDNGDGTLTQTTSYNNTAFNAITAGIATLSGGLAAGLAGQNAQAGATSAENEVLNNTLSAKEKQLLDHAYSFEMPGALVTQSDAAHTLADLQVAQKDPNLSPDERNYFTSATLSVYQAGIQAGVLSANNVGALVSAAIGSMAFSGGGDSPFMTGGMRRSTLPITTGSRTSVSVDGEMPSSLGQGKAAGATNAGGVIIDGKIGSQLEARGWTQQEVQAVVNEGPVGTTMDNRSAGKTPDGLPRSDAASVYGSKSGYVVVNDRTGEVVQVSGKNDPGWIPDSRIKWK